MLSYAGPMCLGNVDGFVLLATLIFSPSLLSAHSTHFNLAQGAIP